MDTQYDVIYWWVGNADAGQWHMMRPYSADIIQHIRRRGYHAVPGKESIGAPDTPPSAEKIAAARAGADMLIVVDDDGEFQMRTSLPEVMEQIFGPIRKEQE